MYTGILIPTAEKKKSTQFYQFHTIFSHIEFLQYTSLHIPRIESK